MISSLTQTPIAAARRRFCFARSISCAAATAARADALNYSEINAKVVLVSHYPMV
jgi:hypothetical protein